MSGMHEFDPGAFGRSLIQAGKDEKPPLGAKARSVTHVASRTAAGSIAWNASGVAYAQVSGGAWAVAGVVAVAAAMGVVVASHHDWAPSAPSVPESSAAVGRVEPSPPVPAQAAPPKPGPGRLGSARPPTLCERVNLADSEPTVCSQPGRSEDMEVVNTCADTVDVFWVDFKCRESFVARLAPGESLGQRTYDTHPWRVRDHATHRLVKEWVGPRMPDPPEVPDGGAPPVVVLPDVVIAEGASAIDSPPTACSHASNKASLRFVNQRTSGVSIVYWVDDDCREKLYERLEPGATWTSSTFDAHPWRVRDENGALLVDFVPDGVDQTVYVSLP